MGLTSKFFGFKNAFKIRVDNKWNLKLMLNLGKFQCVILGVRRL